MKLRYTFTIAIVLTLFISTSTLHASTSAVPVVNTVPDDVEFAVLKKFYDSLGGSAWTTKTNWPAAGAWPTTATSAQFATWYGVTVTNGDVSGITLITKNLIGKLPSNLGDLKALVTLNLNTNGGITGTVPTTLTTLPVLQDLILYRCSLTGSVPAGLFNNLNLKNLNFSYNNLTGTIPTNIGNAPNLITLVLASNNLTGTIPTSVGSLVNLTQLLLWGNQLTGTIPIGVGNCTKLTSLQLQTNLLTGSIPSELGALTQLTGLYLFGNQLTGALPASLASLTKLQVLSLYSNSLSGPIPAWLGNFNALLSLYLYSNQFSGSIPASLGQLTKLNNLSLNNNQLTGNIPAELGTLAAMQNLNLQGNQLSGSLPSTLGNLSKLLYLYANDNQLSGTLPSQLGNLSLLRILYLYNNQLTGELPASLTALSQLTNFNVTNNQLSGTLPSGYFSSWTNLVNGQLGGNQFSGAFPSVINCTKLTTLVCQNNFFTSLPADVNSLPLLNYLSFTNNLLTSVASLNTQVNKASLSLYLQNNQLDFSQLETLPGSGIKTMYLVPQKDITDVAAVNLVVGSSLVLTTRPAGNNSTVTWEKQNPDGTWLTLTNDQDAVATTYTRSAATLGDQGTYRWKMTNTVVTKTTLQSAPMAVASMQQQVLDQWTFQYDYDARQRIIGKKVPGADWVYMVYDNGDRLVFTQDGNQRILNQWTYSQYDALNRPIISGLYTHTSFLDQTGMSNLISTMQYAETYTGNAANHGYTQTVFSTTTFPGTFVPLTITYYDNYDFKTLLNASQFNYQSTDYDEQYKSDAAGNSFTRIIGQVTGTKVKVLGQEKFLWNVNYYDDKYRVVQTISTNARDGIDRTTNVYDFVGKVLQSKTVHNIAATPQTIARTFDYDHAGRLNWVKHSVNGATPIVLFENQYNELGQLVTKKLHSTDNGSTFKQSVDYRYTIRGWLSRINNSDLTADNDSDPRDHFGMNLLYNEVIPGINNTPQYNGNISATKWSTNQGFDDTKERAYKFAYDPMNRLTGATHQEKVTSWNASNSFHEDNITYNLNGGMKTLSRKGANGLQMDNLIFDYAASGNQLQSVSDSWDKTKGFVDGNVTGNDYAYDANGSRNLDKNKGITSITYNHLNQPDKITFQTGNYLRYTYDATGRKLSQGVCDVLNTLKKKTDYVGEFFYENDTLKYIGHEEGRYNTLASAYEYELRDHLGNNRVTFTTKEEQDAATATMETANVSTEQSKFIRYDNARKVYSPLFDKTNGALPGYAIRLSGSANEKEGLARTFAVVPGDVVKTEVYVKYIDSNSSNWTAAFNTLLGQIAGGTAPAGTVIDGASYSTSTSSFPYAGLLNTLGSTGNGPKAYLNWLVFDKNFVFKNGGYVRMTDAAREYGQDVAHEKLSATFTINEPGFVYVYLSNENETPVEVYMDDFAVTLQKSPVINSTEYYPFGLTAASYSREFSLKQNHLYNNKELQDELNLGVYDYGARFYDPTIPVWWQIDPLADKMRRHSPYNYAFDNPVRFIDPDGRGPNDVILGGPEKQKALEQLQASVKGQLTLSMDAKGKLSSTTVAGATIGKDAKQLATAINDHSVVVKVNANTKEQTANGAEVIGGAFLGARNMTGKNGEKGTVALQQVNTNHSEKMDNYYGTPGASILHEVTEGYEGAKLVQQRGQDSGPSGERDSVYPQAHGRATDPAPLVVTPYDSNGKAVDANSPYIDKVEYSMQSPGKKKRY